MGLTDTGYEPRTQAEIFESFQAFLRATISEKLLLTDRTVMGNWVRVGSDHLALLEEAQAASYSAYDRDAAPSDALSSLMKLMGVPRRETPTTGLVVQTLSLGAGLSFAPGDIEFQVVDEPDNIWHNRDTVKSVGAGAYSAVFESALTGSTARALAGTLTVLLSGTGVVSGMNAADAQPGKDRETDSEGRVRLAQAVGAGAQNTVAAIRAALVQVQGVLSAEVFENRSGTPDANGTQGHAIRAVIWDGDPAVAKDSDIAQVIWDRAATFSQGLEIGLAQDENLGQVLVNFERATAQPIAIAVNIESAVGVAIADVRAAILAQMPTTVGAPVIYNRMTQAVFDVSGVDDWATFTIDGGTADLAAAVTRIYTLSESDVVVTGDVS